MKPSWAPAKRKTASTATGTATATATPPDSTKQSATGATGAEKQDATGPKPVASLRARAPEAPPEPLPEWQERYLEILEENCGQKVAAAKAAGTTIRSVQRRRLANSEFERLENDALRTVMDIAESEAKRRAIDGVESRTTTREKDGTERVTVERKYSDTILLRLLERIETGTWRQKHQIEHGGTMTFKTRDERKAALERALAAKAEAGPVSAINGRS